MLFLRHSWTRGPAVLFCRDMAVTAALLAAALCTPAQSRTTIRIDARRPWTEPQPPTYDGGASVSSAGSTIGLNSRYLTLDGKPWLPVMGEFHFSRYPRSEWEDEILKMKAAGVNIVAAYVIWIHHEEIEGQFDWDGQRDLHAFVELCAKHHMYVVARIGPWDHGEVRNGGFPDWVLKQGPTRRNDPAYLRSVRAWYSQIALQLKGLLFKDGGTVIGIQLENEYSLRGPDAGAAHILELKKIARENGLDVPFYFVTGWDDAVVPPRAVIPLYGGYPAAPWDRRIAKLPPQEVYAFRFASRIAADKRAPDSPGPQNHPIDSLPFLTAEMGGGNQVTYHRRPEIAPHDVAAVVPVMLGSGVNLYGTYMFQGGENPDGTLTTLEESQATGYPNDLPIKSYDFQAPLGEFGEERDSFRELKVFNYFLNDFGADLAPMTVHAPDALPRDVADLSTPRAAVRSRGDSGFIFFNNYVRGYPMPERHAAQFEIQLPGGNGKEVVLTIPRYPVELPSGSFFIWPFNLHLGAVTLRYSTAQLFTRISGAETTIYFEALPGIAPELAFDATGVRSIEAPAIKTTHEGRVIYVTGIAPGLENSIRITPHNGAPIRLVVLTPTEAEHAWKVRIGGTEHLLISQQEIVPNPEKESIRLLATQDPHFTFTLIPLLDAPFSASLPLTEVKRGTEIASYSAEAPTRTVKLECTQLKPAGDAPPVPIGPPAFGSKGVAEAPAAGPLPNAAEWAISVPPGAMNGLSGLQLQIDYQGDIARFSENGRLLDDNFYNGQPWTIGLKRFLRPDGSGHFLLTILPLRKDAPVYLELPRLPAFAPNGQADAINNIRLVPEYDLELEAKNPVRQKER